MGRLSNSSVNCPGAEASVWLAKPWMVEISPLTDPFLYPLMTSIVPSSLRV